MATSTESARLVTAKPELMSPEVSECSSSMQSLRLKGFMDARAGMRGERSDLKIQDESSIDIHCSAMYSAAMLTKELVAASTEPLILSLLSEGESYGYALIQEVKRLSGDRIEWTDGMLYPVLHRMEAEGWIESRWGQA